jgi:histidinol dehydrogenase
LGGLVVETTERGAAFALVDEWAPEHLSLHVTDVDEAISAITAAGSVFVGHWSPESAGDYATGANHVLPTGGLAAGYGPLAVEDFGSWRQVQTLTEEGLRSLAPTIRRLAAAEGLTAHAAAVDARLGVE